MDQSVEDALKRWPNVPAVYGWLSLSARGEWRLHPLGDAEQGGPGEGISNPQILGFMGRNYACEPDGRWFFQNGPQRVYVRLDAAPYIVHLQPDSAALITQNGLTVQHVTTWFSDDTGQLYAQTDLGAARVDDRDLSMLAEVLHTPEGDNLLDVLATSPSIDCTLCDPSGRYAALRTPVPLENILEPTHAKRMGFMMNPHAAIPAAQVS